jgi:hypothetical protein
MPKNKIRVQKDGWQHIDIQVYKNQKVVKIIKCHDKGMMFDIEANKAAIKDLSPNAFMLYSHFIQNTPGFIEALSKKRIIESTALTIKTYYTAVSELIEKHYLVPSEHPDYEEYYLFYELPPL